MFFPLFFSGGPIGPIWGPMGSMGQGRWAKADGPGPMGLKDPGLEDPGLEDPPVGVYFRARGRWGPMGSMGLGDPPMGVSSRDHTDIHVWASIYGHP